MRNIKTREGMEFWDKICALKHYGFLHSPDGKRVVKTEGIGNWIDKYEAQQIVDQAQDEINQFRAERDALQLRLNAADQRIDELTAQRAPATFPGYPPVDPGRQQPFTEQFIEDHLGKKPPVETEHDHQIPGTSGMRLNMLANQGE